MPLSKKYLSRIGKKGGRVKSIAKAEAARANGSKGGRRKKPPTPLPAPAE